MFGMIWWVISVACLVWVIIDIMKYQKKMKPEHKFLWILCTVLFGLVTAIVYYFVVKRK